jgi:hypothetical protein
MKDHAMRKYMIHTMTAITTLAIASLVGCGGGGGSGGVSTKTGYFIDSAVEGLEYTSGNTTGITGADGSFKYEEGKPVTFKIGSMILGSVTVTNNRVFPVDLVSGATDETHPKVTLMAQILQTLDSDGDASNGITITQTARQAINHAIEVATADPSQTTSAINLLLASATADRTTPASSLVTEANAKNHLQANLVKEFAGTWTSTFKGSDSGTCQVTIAQSGLISGSCNSSLAGNFTISGRVNSSGTWENASGVSSSGTASGTATTGAVFSGNYSRTGTASGAWTNGANYSGNWTMTKQ